MIAPLDCNENDLALSEIMYASDAMDRILRLIDQFDPRDTGICKAIYIDGQVPVTALSLARPNIWIKDLFEEQLVSYVKMLFPAGAKDSAFIATKVVELSSGENAIIPNWFYFPWKQLLVSLLDRSSFMAVRSCRNRYLITPDEQQVLTEKKIGIVGLSVGNAIVTALALERLCGELRIADFDCLELS